MSWGRLLEDVLRTSPGRRLIDVLKKGRRDFHFRPIWDVFETKIKTFLRRLCDVFVGWVYIWSIFQERIYSWCARSERLDVFLFRAQRVNYFGNSSMLRIYQKNIYKVMIERIYWVVGFQINVKKFSRENLEGHSQPQKFIGWTRPPFPLTSFTSLRGTA